MVHIVSCGEGFLPSEQVRLMGSTILEGLAGWWKDERAPRRYMVAERKREKLNLHLLHLSRTQRATQRPAILSMLQNIYQYQYQYQY